MFKKCLVYFLSSLVTFNTISAETYSYEELVQAQRALFPSSNKYGNTLAKLPPGEYPYNPNVSVATWDELKPYFLPNEHPIKFFLDSIFKKERVVSNRESLIDAGFDINAPKHPQNLIVGSHPFLKGYLIKTYIDTQDMCDWENFSRRIIGAQSIQACINKHGYQRQFKVPKKWLYPLPLDYLPTNSPGCFPKSFVLVVEDMNILNHHQNSIYFKRRITPQILDALYIIVKEVGLLDSVCRGNIPFNQAGQINFIDTEHHHHPHTSIKYERLIRYLSLEMGNYWQRITQCNPIVQGNPAENL